MNVIVNGAPTEVRDGASVAEIVARLGHTRPGAGVAVALNGEVVPASSWTDTLVQDRDRVEVLGAAQGG